MFSSSPATGLLALASVLTAVNGHMIMKTPTPYGASSLNNSPLNADGSDFPCKQRTGVYDMPSTGTNTMAIGESQTLSFTGSAVHGGGSCQLSLTTDKAPTAKSTWQVIHSIEGGCPASADGNLSGNDDTTFQFAIPEGIATGDYTLAWTWFNKIGNREMYMNCAPVSVTAAKKKRYAPAPPTTPKRDTSFPAMAVANLADINGCATKETVDTLFPDPGTSVDKGTDGVSFGPFVSASGATLPCSLLSGGSSGSASAAASAPATSAAAASAASPTAATSAAAITQSSGGSFATASANPVASSAAASVASAVPTAASSAAASAASSGVSPASTGSASSGGNATGTAGASCSTEGQTICSASGTSYLECASGYWQTMAVAAGTKCTGTVAENIHIVAAGKRHLRQHIRRSV